MTPKDHAIIIASQIQVLLKYWRANEKKASLEGFQWYEYADGSTKVIVRYKSGGKIRTADSSMIPRI